ncbi:YbfB/YjiJ family MFS transporter [Leeia sp. TBRC 13508]|uniref:YbfB/YjiJ family MFS transporter n=1 Tax=Leeia speluncae TaxID=2884804 RepID=A0ABS8DA78_9NEIS|nr:YbfB/YjiJ family MFS transporter [Leeia speluncae]MCB6185074.1 YbfB/YjiJ family MFS transporter [Leeia speluncae]
MHNLQTNNDYTKDIVLIGFIALAITMGIGRFAFTPLMPLMLRDGIIDQTIGTEWAASNYFGYLIGALTASTFRQNPPKGLKIGLSGVAFTTLLLAWSHILPMWFGALLRGSAGIFSAWVMVCVSAWCLPVLAARRLATLGGWIYMGVGVGISSVGVITWLGGNQSANTLWLELGTIATAGVVYIIYSIGRPVLQNSILRPTFTGNHAQETATNVATTSRGLIISYAISGFGYIIPATFLPVMAKNLISDPLIFGMVWPIFGAAAALSVAFVVAGVKQLPKMRIWAVAQALMAIGTLLPLLHTSLGVLAVSAFLVGGTFMVATTIGLQIGREMMPKNPTSLLAKMTAGFAAGQITGPVFVRMISNYQIAGQNGISIASLLATVALIITAIWLWQNDKTSGI